MKKLNFLASLLFLSIFMTSCCKDCRNEDIGDVKYPNDENLNLKFNISDSSYQPLHLDLVNSMGILASPTLNEDSKLSLKFRLKEAKNCENYTFISSRYIGLCVDKITNPKDSTKIIKTVETHHIEFIINKNKSDTRLVSQDLKDSFVIKKGQNIDVHIISDDTNFPEPNAPLPNLTGEDCSWEKPVIDVRICRSVIQDF